MALSRDTQGLPLEAFAHYAFNAGENEGEGPTFLSKSELSRSHNVENRTSIATRYGSLVYNVDGSGFPSPMAGNPTIRSIIGHAYQNSYVSFFAADDSIYQNKVTPSAALISGQDTAALYQSQGIAQFMYFVNGVDQPLYYDPNRLTTTLYTVGYDTPAAFTATASAAGGSMSTGTYEYYVTLYDENTDTESNRQDVAVSAAVTGPTGSVTLDDLPIDAEDRSSHWRIYKKTPSGFYHYRLDEITYDAGAPTYTDTSDDTGAKYIAPTDNFRPDLAKSICKHKNAMVYAVDNTVWWSKDYRFQNVPTVNSEPLEDESPTIQVVVSYGEALVVFKDYTIYVFIGDLNQDFLIKKISFNKGTLSPQSVKVTTDGIFFFDSDGKARVITSTDFAFEDLRDQTDISYKYRNKLKLIDNSLYSKCFGVVWETSEVRQYRLFVPVDSIGSTLNHCYVFDRGLAQINNGDSAWFDFQYNIQIASVAVTPEPGGIRHLAVGDNYGLLHRLDVPDFYYDGDEFERAEGDGTVTLGVSTVTISTATMDVDRYVGLELLMYDRYTYDEIFRSKITANTATQFTVVDPLPTLPTDDPYITVGGYLSYFASANYTHNRQGRCRPFKLSMLFDRNFGGSEVQAFTNYDFNTTFNYTYDYINNPVNPSRNPLSDNYSLDISGSAPRYDTALYDEDSYEGVLYGTLDFLLNCKYFFNHVSWGVITRAPSQPFGYLGATYIYQFKGSMTP